MDKKKPKSSRPTPSEKENPGVRKSPNKTKVSFKAGDKVERNIDGCWFPAEIQSKEPSSFTIKYLDDGNIESQVPGDEIRLLSEASRKEDRISGVKNVLAKPLLGLVDDDSEARSAHVPTVIVHSNVETGKCKGFLEDFKTRLTNPL